jgi:hypothetical protein
MAARFGANVGRHSSPPLLRAPPYHRFCGVPKPAGRFAGEA